MLFQNFLEDMGERPGADKSLDRYPDKDGDYEPGNCRWATKLEQTVNRKQTIFITHLGETKTLAEWARKFQVSYFLAYARLKKGHPYELVFKKGHL